MQPRLVRSRSAWTPVSPPGGAWVCSRIGRVPLSLVAVPLEAPSSPSPVLPVPVLGGPQAPLRTPAARPRAGFLRAERECACFFRPDRWIIVD